MRLNEVINRFALVSGLEPFEVSKWTPLCIDAMDEVRRFRRNGVKQSEENNLRLSNLAGVLAYYKYVLYSFQGVSSFTAGDVSITHSSDAVDRAKSLWETERKSAGDLIECDDFYFGRIG